METRQKYYILDGREPVATDMMTWARFFEDKDSRVVAQDDLGGGISVSTVFLGMDHQWGDGPPLIFETMIFGGVHDQYQDRYSTWNEAEEGHKRAVELSLSERN